MRLVEYENGYYYVENGDRARSLGHKDRARAVREARRLSLELAERKRTRFDPTPTLSRVLGLYLAHHTPKKCASEQQFDHRRARM